VAGDIEDLCIKKRYHSSIIICLSFHACLYPSPTTTAISGLVPYVDGTTYHHEIQWLDSVKRECAYFVTVYVTRTIDKSSQHVYAFS